MNTQINGFYPTIGYPLEPPAVPQQLLQPPLVELQSPQGDDQPPPVVVNSNPSVVAEDGTCVIIHCELRTSTNQVHIVTFGITIMILKYSKHCSSVIRMLDFSHNRFAPQVDKLLISTYVHEQS